jgi:methyl coenzyme M reductase gamma subunit
VIAKHVPIRSLGKSDFAGLVSYITDEQDKTERLGHIAVTNCQASTMQAVISEVLATQRLNTRATGDKTYHLMVAFPPGESPNAEVLMNIEERICAALGYEEHQRVSAVHHDTDHLHLHIAINKIHPERYTMHEPFQSYRTLAEICTKLEIEHGLQKVNHKSGRILSEGRATDMEHHSGIESLITWIRRECLEEIRGAQSWSELHQVMNENGLDLLERANGLVIVAEGGTAVKASTVARELSKPKLAARLGPFEASPERQKKTKILRSYQKDPVRMRINTVELYARYKDEQKSLTIARAEALAKAKRRKDRSIEDAKRFNRLRRATVKIVDSKGINKKMLYYQASAALRASLGAIHKDYAKEREQLYLGFQRRTWADWLKQEALSGSAEALAALRSRETAQGLKGNTVQAEGKTLPGHVPVQDNITKNGTIIFRIGRSAVRDDGDRLQVSREVTSEGLQAALRLAIERYGERIIVNGTSEFKTQIVRASVDSQLPITFADPGLERRRRDLLTKEKANEQNELHSDRGRVDRHSAGSSESSAVGDKRIERSITLAKFNDSRAVWASVCPGNIDGKPDIGRIGCVPPPQGRNRLRMLSKLGLVRIASGSEVLLPRDVSHHLEQHGAKSDNTLRRNVFRSGVTDDHIAAAKKYIGEREQKRLNIYDIPKHSLYNGQNGAATYVGTRNVDDHVLALLKQDDEIIVLPIDQPMAKCLKHVRVGSLVTVTPKGSIKTSNGRSI